MSNLKIALIAEDNTDCEAIRTIVHRVLGAEVTTKKWASKGCSSLTKKLRAKLKLLSSEGCNIFIVVHDLDRNPQNGSLNNEQALRSKLEELSSEIESLKKHICIPIEELEAWFWSDPEVIKYLGGEKGKAHPNPHEIKSPKEKLIELSVGENRKPRYSTNMNVELAERLNLNICSNRCASFKNLLNFLRSL
ncbi:MULTISPECIES: DUF4276 family protein [Aphanizomenon]|jgi:hypothetical protein|uniref:DUF4276 family protein n=1 Tax=Aphanizomenon flos-aquae FACHB-1040 TaxID=2692887 RepID=A0ABR8C368_APHFL|nr:MULTISPECIES: DUF4276 family protein [Aphanizomenon]MBO1069855.1 DUF4276 family protein [Dolichospermum sp. DEX189]MDK2408894.1 DUF4276 family protein [Aphanizomenon sp. 202]MDK2459370.1 DUF4276 family protein [Aphanizomenon sp. PH219]QSV72274.1 MAG: DUF4276 family protein [Aphanizomenon flos-aquae KM1D3_PB]KHG39400.1 hypothetical protein OA07_24060 [Aphanizomenon flos-aquae 2012/KM1/D3]